MAYQFNPFTGNFDIVITDHTKLSNIGTNTHAQIDDHLADSSQAHSDYLINNGDDTTTGILTAAKFLVDYTTAGSDYDMIRDDLSISYTTADGVDSSRYRALMSDMDYTANASGFSIFQQTIKWLVLDMDIVNTLSFLFQPEIKAIEVDVNLNSAGTSVTYDKLVGVTLACAGGSATNAVFNVTATNTNPSGTWIACRTAAVISNTNNSRAAVGYQGYVQNTDITAQGQVVALQPFVFNTPAVKDVYFMQPLVSGTTADKSRIFAMHSGGYNILASVANLIATSTTYTNLSGIGTKTFTGAGLNDMYVLGGLTTNTTTNYKVEIDGTGATDTFKWSDDGGSTWDATGVAITASTTTPQTLNNGITIRFLAKTGHTSGNSWTWTATPPFSHFVPSTSTGWLCTEQSAEINGVLYCDNTTTALQIGEGAAGIDYRILFDGADNDGVLTWMEDEDYFQFADDIMFADSEKVKFGTGVDMDLYYDGTSGYLHTDLVAASDLHIDCGTDKTLVLDETVFNDANVGSLVLVTGGTLPAVVELVESDGGASGIYSRGFAVGEQGSGSIEIPHDYSEGTNLVFHVHWVGQDAPTGTDNVRWQLTYSVTRDGVVTPATTTVVAADDTAFDTQYKWMRTDVATITGTNFKIGDQFNFTITRIASSGDAYAGEAVVATLGFHYECDTLGSRQIGTK